MTDKTSTARIVTASDATPADKIMGRSAAAWRNDFLIKHFGLTDETVKNAKWEKPKFEAHERETAKREFKATLMERKRNGQLVEIAAVRIGMFGKLLDKPVKQPKQEVAPAAPQLSKLEQAVQEHMAENPDADAAVVEMEIAQMLAEG